MWHEVAAAALVGIALSDSLLCVFMGACFASADRRLGRGFIAGRTLGVLALCLAVGLLGSTLLVDRGALALVFGASSLAIAAVIAATALGPSVVGGCPVAGAAQGWRLSADGGACEGDCAACGDAQHPHDACANVPRRLSFLTRSRRPLLAGLALGAVRGGTPCLKLTLLVPLLLVSSPGTVLLMSLAYIATSSLYPAIGLLAGRTVRDALGSHRWLRLMGAAGVALVGAYTLFKYWTVSCTGLGG